MAGGFNFLVDLGDGAVRGNDEGAAVDAHVFFAHEFFQAVDAIGLRHLILFVGEEGEGEVVFIGEFLVGFDAVGADAVDGDVGVGEF